MTEPTTTPHNMPKDQRLMTCISVLPRRYWEIAAEIDKEVKKIVDERYATAKQLLTENRDMLEYISKTLLDKETLDEKEFVELMEKVKNDRQQNC